jgi:hypothetical protein
VLKGAFKRLAVGTHVTFVEEMGEKGPQASTVRSSACSCCLPARPPAGHHAVTATLKARVEALQASWPREARDGRSPVGLRA